MLKCRLQHRDVNLAGVKFGPGAASRNENNVATCLQAAYKVPPCNQRHKRFMRPIIRTRLHQADGHRANCSRCPKGRA